MSLCRKKNKDEQLEDISIVNEIKEPFSWDVFWDEQVMGRWKTFRSFLDKKGITRFIHSPFQAKSRLVVMLLAIFIGVLVGIVPRAIHLGREANARASESELAEIIGKSYSSGIFGVEPLASSQYEKHHVLAFNLTGDTDNGIPSTTEPYTVELKPFSGVIYPDKVKYSYHVVPIDSKNRLLLVYIDRTEQNDTTGIYTINIALNDQRGFNTPLRVILSDTQETTKLYDGYRIDLSVLSNDLSVNGQSEAIKTAQKELDDALDKYKLTYDRLVASGYTLDIDTDGLRKVAEERMILKSLTDDSTVKDVDGLSASDNSSELRYTTGFTYKGTHYSSDSFKTGTPVYASPSEQEKANTEASNRPQEYTQIKADYDALTKQVSKVMNAVSKLNSTRKSKFESLSTLKRSLSQQVYFDMFTDGGTTKDNIKVTQK